MGVDAPYEVVTASFAHLDGAAQALAALERAQRADLLDIENAAVVKDAAGAGQGDERDIVTEQELTDSLDIALAADERGARKREIQGPWVGGRRSGHRGTRIAGRTEPISSLPITRSVPWGGGAGNGRYGNHLGSIHRSCFITRPDVSLPLLTGCGLRHRCRLAG